jgi:hypothetical protein
MQVLIMAVLKSLVAGVYTAYFLFLSIHTSANHVFCCVTFL